MPLTEKGAKIKSAMQEQYGKERGESVFYASKNKGTIKGVDEFMSTEGEGNTADAPFELANTSDIGSEEIVGDIPKEKVGDPSDKTTVPKGQTVPRVMSESLTPVRDAPLSIPVGDQSLTNMNARNKAFWKR